MGEGPSHQIKEIKDKYVYIPLLQVLEQLLMCPVVYEEVRSYSHFLLQYYVCLSLGFPCDYKGNARSSEIR